MAANNVKKPSTPADKLIMVLFVLLIAVVLGLAVFATYSKISDNVAEKEIEQENTAIENGEQEANVRYLASQSGMSEADYLAQYGLSENTEITGETTQTDLMDCMTLENYYKYTDDINGTSEDEATDIEQVLTDWSASDFGITKDTIYSDAMETLPVINYVGGEDEFNSMLESYSNEGFDVSAITSDMSVKDAQDKLSEIVQAGATYTPVPTEAAETTGEESAAE